MITMIIKNGRQQKEIDLDAEIHCASHNAYS